MPSPSVTTTTKKVVTIEPRLRRKLQTELRAYAAVKHQIEVLKHALEKHTVALGAIRDEMGEMSISLDGYTITLVAGTYKQFNRKRFVSLGGDLAIYDQAVDERPRRAYNKITTPGAAEEEEE